MLNATVEPAPGTRTTTTHRPGCTRPGWQVERSSSIAGVSIARCVKCGAVELRTESTR